jgi:hypothetical protein
MASYMSCLEGNQEQQNIRPFSAINIKSIENAKRVHVHTSSA